MRNRIVASALKEEPSMSISNVVERVEHEFLRALYELADKKAKYGISFADIQARFGLSEAQADEACDYWAERGIVEFPQVNQVALTHIGLRRAARLADRNWGPNLPF
jgi:Mn-dependent DtxR family transcriptional regulator